MLNKLLLPRLARGFAFVSTKAVLVRKRRRTFGAHKPEETPSGRELSPQVTEGECESSFFSKINRVSRAPSTAARSPFRCGSVTLVFCQPTGLPFIALAPLRFSLRLGPAADLTAHRAVIQHRVAASLSPGGRQLCFHLVRFIGFALMIRLCLQLETRPCGRALCVWYDSRYCDEADGQMQNGRSEPEADIVCAEADICIQNG